MSRRRPVAKLAKFETDDESLQQKALEAGRFVLVYEYRNNVLPGPVEVAAHVLGEEPDPENLRLQRIGSQLYRLFGPQLASLHNDPSRYIQAWERFGCRDELYQLMAAQQQEQQP